MKARKITSEEIEALRVASLPTRPCASVSEGGRGLGSKEMKEAFDRLPILIAERLNLLIDDIGREGGVADTIPSGIAVGHSLADLICDIGSGALAGYLDVFGQPLTELILELKGEISELKRMLGEARNV